MKLADGTVTFAGRDPSVCNLCSPIETEWVDFTSRPVHVEMKYILRAGDNVATSVAYIQWRVDIELQVYHFCPWAPFYPSSNQFTSGDYSFDHMPINAGTISTVIVPY